MDNNTLDVVIVVFILALIFLSMRLWSSRRRASGSTYDGSDGGDSGSGQSGSSHHSHHGSHHGGDFGGHHGGDFGGGHH
jgi:uncharacterized membrane protein